MTDDLPRSIREAGVVGAGGAGFPTHVKAEAKAEVVIANGAECEPLLQKDKEIMLARPEAVLDGVERMMRATGARRGVLALKDKHVELIDVFGKLLKERPGMELLVLGDFYPAGDEFCLVYDATGKLIPPGGLPIQIGAVVDNVETLINIAGAPSPVTDTWLTVTGAVKSPGTFRLPVGTSFAHAVSLAGGAKDKEYAVLDGGAMMGRVVADMETPATKTTGGLIVLPKGHPLVRRKSSPRAVFSRVGKSVCDQCSLCTELCPRYLLGYDVQPHRVMRSLQFTGPDRRPMSEWALLCCECSLCSLSSCPEELDPARICAAAKGDLREEGVAWKNARLNAGRMPAAHPMRDYRKVPLKRLIKRLGLADYVADAPLRDAGSVRSVRIPLKQHLGAPAVCVVKKGQKVKRGQLLAEVPEGKLGARAHASIDGAVQSIGGSVWIEG